MTRAPLPTPYCRRARRPSPSGQLPPTSRLSVTPRALRLAMCYELAESVALGITRALAGDQNETFQSQDGLASPSQLWRQRVFERPACCDVRTGSVPSTPFGGTRGACDSLSSSMAPRYYCRVVRPLPCPQQPRSPRRIKVLSSPTCSLLAAESRPIMIAPPHRSPALKAARAMHYGLLAPVCTHDNVIATFRMARSSRATHVCNARRVPRT